MNDRRAFLAAIAGAPDDDMPRLAFADWLDEHPEGDRDTATAEFIRASCLGRRHASPQMPRAAYTWLQEHWQRLVPVTLAKHLAEVVRPGPAGEVALDRVGWIRSGRVIHLRMRFGPLSGTRPSLPMWYPMDFDFHRGFLRVALIWSFYASTHLLPSLVADQPLGRLVWVESGGLKERPFSPSYAGGA